MLNKVITVLQLAPLVKEVVDMFSTTGSNSPNLHKVSDTTKFNDYHKRVIKAEHAAAVIQRRTGTSHITNQELADLLNQKFGLNKSVRSYSRIWNEKEE
jgi:hypothetical protein